MIILIVLKGAAAGIIIIGIHQHASSALCNKHMNTKNETKYMAQGRMNTKSGHSKFYLVFPFLLSVLKYGTQFFFLLTLSCFPLFFARFQDLLTLARVRFVRAYASVSEAARMPCSHPRCFYGQNNCETWNKWFCDLFPRSLSFPAFGLEKNQSVYSWEKKLTGYIN